MSVPGWMKLLVRPLHNSVAVAGVAVGERNRCGRHGPPRRALDRLEHAIAAQRETPSPGDVVITGGVTAAVPVERGDVVEAMLGNSSTAVHQLLGQGLGLLDCARRLGWALNTVKRYARAATAEQLQRPPRYGRTMVDPYREHLRQRLAAEPNVAVTRKCRRGLQADAVVHVPVGGGAGRPGAQCRARLVVGQPGGGVGAGRPSCGSRCCHAAYLGTTLGAPSKGHEGERPGGREALPSERKHVRSHQTPPDTTRSREAEWRR